MMILDTTRRASAETRREAVPSHPTLHAGQEVDGVVAESLLSLGARFEIWKARDPHGNSVALKLSHDSDEDQRQLLHNERLALEHLAVHPRIPNYRGTNKDGSSPAYLLTSYVPGIRLSEYASIAELGPLGALDLMVDILLIVEYIHRREVLHCDLKPDNILVVPVGKRIEPVIIDFDISRLPAQLNPSRSEEEGLIVGTAEYMSPEQSAFWPEELDERSDLYALAKTLHELMTGQIIRAPEGMYGVALLDFYSDIARKGAFAAPSEVIEYWPKEWDPVILRSLDYDIHRRHPDASSLRKDLMRILDLAQDLPIAQTSRGQYSGSHQGIEELMGAGQHHQEPAKFTTRRRAQDIADLPTAAMWYH